MAELGSLSKASDRLRVAQPALSRQIKLLEHDLGLTLFVRHGRGMRPTDAGLMLLERTATVVRQLEQARDDVLSAAGEPCGRVVVGLVPTVGSALALSLTRRIVKDVPGVTLRLVEAYGGYLIDGLHRSEIDLAVIYGPAEPLHLNAETLRHDNLFAVGAAGCGLAENLAVSLSWLADKCLVLPSAPHALRLLVDRAFATEGIVPAVAVETDSFGAMLNIVRGGVGFTLLPFYAVAGEVQTRQLEAAPATPTLRRELILALPSKHRGSAAAQVVANIIRDEAGRLDHGPS